MLNKNLPPELPLDVVIAELGFHKYSFQSAYNMLDSIAGEGLIKIRFKFQQILNCQLESNGADPDYRDEGFTTSRQYCGETTFIDTFDKSKEVYVRSLNIHSDHSTVSIPSIICQGEPYLITDEYGVYIESITLSTSGLYVRKSELQQYLESIQATPQTKTTIKPKKLRVQSQREEVLEDWLNSQSTSTHSAALTFQEIYDHINSPTKSHIWKKLATIHSKLFEKNSVATIKKFFFKWGHITFKDGTGKGR
jgi:hypothetical protein